MRCVPANSNAYERKTDVLSSVTAQTMTDGTAPKLKSNSLSILQLTADENSFILLIFCDTAGYPLTDNTSVMKRAN